MTFIKKGVALGALATGGMLVATTSAALALAPTHVTVGGAPAGNVDVSGDLLGTSQAEFYTNFGVDTICDTSEIDGYVINGAEVSQGSKVGAITDLTFSDCVAVAGLDLPVIIEMEGAAEYEFIALDEFAPNAPIDVEIQGIEAYMHSTGSPTYACEIRASGSVFGTIYPGTTANGHDAEIEITGGQFLNIQAFDGNGNPAAASCAGQIYTGDTAEMFGDFSINADNPAYGPISHS